ncbi:MAG: hypothetical protein QM664_01565 [Flavihumibacter sp.]
MIPFFEKITDTLEALKIPYMLSGSVAMSVYIVPRATRDFDFVISLLQKDIDLFVQQFTEQYYCDKEAVKDAVQQRSMFNIIDPLSGFKADFVILKDEPYRQEEFSRRKKVAFMSRPIFLVSPEDLILSKLIWIQDIQSTQQADDIKNLSALPDLDWVYIKKWINRLAIRTFDLLPA